MSTVTAASTSDTDVQTAIDSAIAGVGDAIVNVPAGSSTWSTGISKTLTKKLTLTGAGIGSTVITTNTSIIGVLFLGVTASNYLTISGFSFLGSGTHGDGIVQIYGANTAGTREQGFRFHHNLITISTSGRGMSVVGIFGLIDHNTMSVTASIQMLSIYGSFEGPDGGYTPWSYPLTLGSTNAVYIEDNNFPNIDDYGEDILDIYGGGRVVFRHNQCTNVHIGSHGFDSGFRRSTFSIEVYSNIFTNNTAGQYRAHTCRGGTGVFWNNIYNGTHSTFYDVTMLIYRATILGPYSWQYCDGTQWDIGSADLSSGPPTEPNSRECVTAGTGVRFVGTSDALPLSSGGTIYVDGAGSHGYPGRDQPGRTHDQALAPLYEWNNGAVHISGYDGGGTYPPNNVGVPFTTWIAENRDFYNYQAGAFDGTVGTGQGLRSARPATCTTGVGYFATDENIFYVATATNTWSVYYAPYTYPFPTGSSNVTVLMPARMI